MENDNYEIQLARRKTILHINMLNKFVKREEVVAHVLIADVGESDDDDQWPDITDFDEREICVNIGQHLETMTNKRYCVTYLKNFQMCSLTGWVN